MVEWSGCRQLYFSRTWIEFSLILNSNSHFQVWRSFISQRLDQIIAHSSWLFLPTLSHSRSRLSFLIFGQNMNHLLMWWRKTGLLISTHILSIFLIINWISWRKLLSSWSRETYGDTFQKISSLGQVVLVHEAEFEMNPSQQNRERLRKVQA